MTNLAEDPKYLNFNIHQTSYRQIDGHDIAADVFVPKSLIASLSTERRVRRPLILRFHGGALVCMANTSQLGLKECRWKR